jgi:toxin ParE1/3/4
LKRTRLRPQAEAALPEATRHCTTEGSVELAERLFETTIAALEPIERVPGMGSLRLGHLGEIPGLRVWRITDFPMQWLYFDANDDLDVVRLLGDRQDIVAVLSAGE